MEKLNVNRCGGEPDDAIFHLWSSTPTVEITEHGPVAWFVCGRCPARVLHDPETEDGFPAEPIVVYPPACFDEPLDEGLLAEGHDRRCKPLRDAWECVHGCPVLLALQLRSHAAATRCGCPRTASGDVVHLDGCIEESVQEFRRELGGPPDEAAQAAIDEHLDELDAELEASARAKPGDGYAGRYPDPLANDTDPAPPSEELARAIAHALDEDDIPTQRYPAHVESAASIFDRVEALFGRPFKIGDDAGMDMAFDALGGIEG